MPSKEGCMKCSTNGPRYLRTFYLQICLFTFEKWPKMTLFQSKKDILSANSRFAVQNDRTYLSRITRETCIRWVSGYFLVTKVKRLWWYCSRSAKSGHGQLLLLVVARTIIINDNLQMKVLKIQIVQEKKLWNIFILYFFTKAVLFHFQRNYFGFTKRLGIQWDVL